MRRFLVVALAACSSPKAPDVQPGSAGSAASGSAAVTSDAAITTGGLVARFETPAGAMEASAAKLAFVVENQGSTEELLDLDQLSSAIFAIEVFDANGKQIYTIPPGMPPANYQPRRAPIVPGAERRFEVTLNVFSPELAAGSYTARLRPETIRSETVRFAIR
jgi:hypothetical protein